MEPVIAVALIGILGSVVAAAVTFWLSRRRDREAEWRKEKLTYYKAFVESMSGVIDGDASDEGQRLFARTTNNLLLFAPQGVISALNEFREEIRVSNTNRSREKHDQLLAKLLLAIRLDVGVSPKDEASSFKPALWASGANRNAT